MKKERLKGKIAFDGLVREWWTWFFERGIAF